MKFKAILQDDTAVKDFKSTISMFAKTSRFCTFIITSNSIKILSNDEQNTNYRLWVEIPKDIFFSEFEMDGDYPDENIIYFNTVATQCATVFNLTQYVYSKVMLCLTASGPVFCLTIEIEASALDSSNIRIITHDIPIEKINRSDWRDYRIPKVDATLPYVEVSCKSIANVIDGIKNFDPLVLVMLKPSGELYFIMDTAELTISNYFYDLTLLDSECQPKTNVQPNDEFYCMMAVKKLTSYLSNLDYSAFALGHQSYMAIASEKYIVIKSVVNRRIAIYGLVAATVSIE